jgi:hypothetical protein
MRTNPEYPTEWAIVTEEDESQKQGTVSPADPPVEEEDSQILQAYIVAAA